MDNQEFEALDDEEQIRVFAKSSIRQRGEFLMRANDPARLTRGLSGEELYLITREMDVEERSYVICHASLPQLFFISDIDCWKKDEINSVGFLRWLETLQYADEKLLLQWLTQMDYEAVVAGLQKFVEVLKPEWEYVVDDVLGDRPYFTLDHRYFICVEESNMATLRRALEVLYENHRGRYVAVLEGILGESEYELEEEAYRRRETRLADRGFPDMETAQRILVPLTRQEFEQFDKKNPERKSKSAVPISEEPRLIYPVLWSMERLFLDDVLATFRDDPLAVSDGLYEELAWLSNKVLVCEGIDFTSEAKVRRGVVRSRHILNLGLEVLSRKDMATAHAILKERWLETVFRYGMGLLCELRNRVHDLVRVRWKGDALHLLEFLDSPYDFIVRGLQLTPIPACYDDRKQDELDYLRDFTTLLDFERTQRAIEQVEKMHAFLYALGKVSGGSGATLFRLMGNAFIRHTLHKKSSIKPVSPEDLKLFVTRTFADQGARRKLNREIRESFLTDFFSEADRELLRPLWGLLFARMEEEFEGLKCSADIRYDYTTPVCLIRREQQQKKAKKATRRR
ncbi:MAG: DUF6178 family protein [Candidatus Omnitrophota bacterium]|nr:DUF6178 family protein [Candidatus Omnitrophota bacterium]